MRDRGRIGTICLVRSGCTATWPIAHKSLAFNALPPDPRRPPGGAARRPTRLVAPGGNMKNGLGRISLGASTHPSLARVCQNGTLGPAVRRSGRSTTHSLDATPIMCDGASMREMKTTVAFPDEDIGLVHINARYVVTAEIGWPGDDGKAVVTVCLVLGDGALREYRAGSSEPDAKRLLQKILDAIDRANCLRS